MVRKELQHIVTLADLFATHRGITHWRVSAIIRKSDKGPGDGQWIQKLKNGGGCSVTTEKEVVQRFSDMWPADLEWPSDIPRPAPTKKERAA
ncbi:MAG: hypothetical protein AAF618_00325 [Pseudomonadota bacterium]